MKLGELQCRIDKLHSIFRERPRELAPSAKINRTNIAIPKRNRNDQLDLIGRLQKLHLELVLVRSRDARTLLATSYTVRWTILRSRLILDYNAFRNLWKR